MDKKENSVALEVGKNELQVLDFEFAGFHFGINVAQVKELMRYRDIERMPHSLPYIEGIIRLRDEVYTVVDFAQYMDLPASKDPEHDLLIIIDSTQINAALHVHKVNGVSRISRDTMEKPDSVINSDKKDIIIDAAKLDDRTINLIDCEKIIYE